MPPIIKPNIYRAWINQPSKFDPLHHMHGTKCIAVQYPEVTVRLYFTEGPIHSMNASKNWISRCPL